MPDITYMGNELSMRLPLRVEGHADGVDIRDDRGDVIVEGLTNAADAHYLVDAANEYRIIRDAKIDALADFKKAMWAFNLGEPPPTLQTLLNLITERIERLKR